MIQNEYSEPFVSVNRSRTFLLLAWARLWAPRHVTRWRVLSPDVERNGTRLELEPVTGRSHQLRVHLQAIGHPILGDDLYASPDAVARASRLLLHACALMLPHPATGDLLSFISAPPF